MSNVSFLGEACIRVAFGALVIHRYRGQHRRAGGMRQCQLGKGRAQPGSAGAWQHVGRRLLCLVSGRSHERGFHNKNVIRDLARHFQKAHCTGKVGFGSVLPAPALRDRQQAQQLEPGLASTERGVHRDGSGARGAP